jgi:hypothetical protein
MFKRNHIYIALVATSLSLGASQAFAQETVNSVATVSVSNAFTLQEVAPINFGTIRVASNLDTSDDDGTTGIDATTGALVQVFANGNPSLLTDDVQTESVATVTEILPGAPAEYAITGAAPFSALNVTLPSNVNLVNPASPGAIFILSFQADNFEIVGGTNDGDAYDTTATSNLVTDATGAVGFLMGGQIATGIAAEADFGDGAYTGSYEVVVSY